MEKTPYISITAGLRQQARALRKAAIKLDEAAEYFEKEDNGEKETTEEKDEEAEEQEADKEKAKPPNFTSGWPTLSPE